jgi:toxin ParE1/3/4
MNYEVVWEMDAIDDREGILDFLFDNAGENVAVATDNKFDETATLLSSNPFMGKTWEGKERKLIIKKIPYLIFYYVDEIERRVKVVRILHSSRNYP